MDWKLTVLLIVQVVCAATTIILVLLQHGKGADMGAAFGGGASGSLFGASGSANFLSRATKYAAGIFFAATIGMAYSANVLRGAHEDAGVMSAAPPAAATKEIPGEAPSPATAPASGAPAGGSAVQAGKDKAADIPK